MPSLALNIARLSLRAMPFRNIKNRLIDRTFLRALPFAEASLEVRTRDGFTIAVDPRDMLGRHLYLLGEFEQGVCDLLAACGRPGETMWDIGANIGLMSCAWLHRVPSSRVVAVEPLPDIHARLAANVGRFGAERVALVRAAVSDHRGEAVLQRVEGHLGASGIVERPDRSRPHEVASLRTGEDLEAEVAARADGRAWRGPSVVKIDVEGHELAVLLGIRGVIQRHRPRLILFEHLASDRTLPREITEFFEASGGVDYEVYQLMRDWSRTWLVPYVQASEVARKRGWVRTDDFAAFPRESHDQVQLMLASWWGSVGR
jgi:FkbM family methyltransferase